MTTSTVERTSYLKNGGQQDKRPRHGRAAKGLSAHPFCRHAPRIARCCRVANSVKVLNI
jgi:hypothetical protein